MRSPRFATGQKVKVAASKLYRQPKGEYRVVSAMPASSGAMQYRIKGDQESYERVIDEIHLSPEESVPA